MTFLITAVVVITHHEPVGKHESLRFSGHLYVHMYVHNWAYVYNEEYTSACMLI